MDLQYIVMVLAAVLAALHTCHMDEAFSKKIYCGTRLSDTLSTVCKGVYNTLNKKPEIYGNPNYFNSQRISSDQRSLTPYLKTKESASSMITNYRRRRKRGVYNECCEKPCSLEELASYCGGRK